VDGGGDVRMTFVNYFFLIQIEKKVVSHFHYYFVSHHNYVCFTFLSFFGISTSAPQLLICVATKELKSKQ